MADSPSVVKKETGTGVSQGTSAFTSNRVLNIKYHDGPLAGEQLGYEDIGKLSLGSTKAQELRNKILAANILSKDRIKKSYPQVLVPHHAIRIFRHVKNYDPNTGYLKGDKGDLLAGIAGLASNIAGAAFDYLGMGLVNKLISPLSNALTDKVESSPQAEPGIDYFEVQPQDSYHDFLGVKFGYSYDESVTDFTLTVNNERGKNKNTFMSGDVIEFYFDLVDDETLAAGEKQAMFVEHDHISTSGLNLCFTGILETVDYVNTSDGLTVVWSGRNGASILTQREVNETYPLQGFGFGASVGTMSYEQIIWDLITKNTGMVVGEVDLGNYPLFSQLFAEGEGAGDKDKMTAGDDLNSMDLMGDPKTLRGDVSAFRQGLKEVMEKHAFCVYQDAKTGEKRIRWSALLEFDLFRPKTFGASEVSGAVGTGGENASPKGLEAGSLGSYHYGANEPGYTHLPYNLRFQTKLGRDLFKYQYDKAQKTFKKILDRAPIKTEVQQKEGPMVICIPMNSLVSDKGIGGTMREIKEALYTEFIQPEQTGQSSIPPNLFKQFKTALDQAYKKYTPNQQKLVEFSEIKDLKKIILGAKNFDRNSVPIASEAQDPADAAIPNLGAFLMIPIDPAAYLGESTRSVGVGISNVSGKQGIVRSDGSVDAKYDATNYPDPIMDISTLFTMDTTGKSDSSGRQLKGAITIIITPVAPETEMLRGAGGVQAGRMDFIQVEVIYNSGEGPSKNKGPVLNRIMINSVSVLAQVLDQTGLFNIMLTGKVTAADNAYSGGFSQPVAKQTITFVPAGSSIMPKVSSPMDTYVNVTFAATGSVLESAQKILAKFFACVLYVDEYNIVHVRFRYKNLQKPGTNAPPIWGLYGGQPIYPRLFKSTLKDQLKMTPNAVIIFGQCNAGGEQIIARADHGLLQGRFGEFHKMEDAEDTINSKFEAYNIAKNKLLDYIRNGYAAAVECDIIPELRPGHRLDVVDPITNMVGRFIIENIQWEYSKDSAMKMTVGMASMMLATDDSYTTAAIQLEKSMNEDYKMRTQIGGQGSGNKDSYFLGSLLRTMSVEAGKSVSSAALKEEQQKWQKEADVYSDTKDLPEFTLEGDSSVISFYGRRGFDGEPVDPEKLSASPADVNPNSTLGRQ